MEDSIELIEDGSLLGGRSAQLELQNRRSSIISRPQDGARGQRREYPTL